MYHQKMYLTTLCWLMIMMKYPNYVPSNKQSQQTIKQDKVIQEVVSPEVSKVNDYVISRKQGDQLQFFPEFWKKD